MFKICIIICVCIHSVNSLPNPVARSLNRKILTGYDCWFFTDNDGANLNWAHWSKTSRAPAPPISPTNTGIAFDQYPDVSEYQDLYDTNLTIRGSHAVAKLFSSYDSSTIDLHFKWIRDYKIDGIILPRFVNSLTDQKHLAAFNKCLANVNASATETKRTFYIMYDTSGSDPVTYKTIIQNDWKWLQQQGYIDSPYYQYHVNKPVVGIWGFGFADRNITRASAVALINWLRSPPSTFQPAYIMGGVPFNWRTGTGDSDHNWLNVFRSFDVLSPWSVGRYNYGNYMNAFNTVQMPDYNYLKNYPNVSYAPVIWPGFSWANLKDDPTTFNRIPRLGGKFYCLQAAKVLYFRPLFIFVAMFNEVNEGTAIFKTVPTKAMTPAIANFTFLNIDGYNLPSDFFLTLTGNINTVGKSKICFENNLCTAASVCNVTFTH
jgi:hypothetical protein